jgi:hypothetical protein
LSYLFKYLADRIRNGSISFIVRNPITIHSCTVWNLIMILHACTIWNSKMIYLYTVWV